VGGNPSAGSGGGGRWEGTHQLVLVEGVGGRGPTSWFWWRERTHQLVLVEGEEVQTPDHLPFARFHSLRLDPIPHPTEYVNTRNMHLHSVCLAHESIVGMASCSRHVYM